MCRIATLTFLFAYVIVLAHFAISLFGLFGQEQGSLSGVLLIPLGLPWNAVFQDVAEAYRLWLVVLPPAVNLIVLQGLSRAMAQSRN